MFDAKKIFLFLILTKSASASEASDWSNDVMPDNTWHKGFKPEFLYCKNKTNTDIEVYQQAIEYWKSKGRLEGISTEIRVTDCVNHPDDLGKIRLAGDEEIDEGYYGVTTRRLVEITTADGKVGKYVGSAYIRIEKKYANDLNMVIHELGHAIGMNHKHEKDSIMYRHHADEETKL